MKTMIDPPQNNSDLLAEIERLKAENTRYREALLSIQSRTFHWVMTNDNAADLLLVLRPIREKCREALENKV